MYLLRKTYMHKSIIISNLPTKLFDPEYYHPLPTHSNGMSRMDYKTNIASIQLEVFGSKTLDESLWLMPAAYLDYAQITVFIDLSKLLRLTLSNELYVYSKFMFGIHNHPDHYSKLAANLI